MQVKKGKSLSFLQIDFIKNCFLYRGAEPHMVSNEVAPATHEDSLVKRVSFAKMDAPALLL